MNRYLSLISIVFIFTTSCHKNNETISDPTTSSKVTEIFALSSTDEQKAAFSLLTDYEKVVLWKTHFSRTKKISSLTDTQAAFVEKVSDQLKPDMFNDNNKIRYAGQFAEWIYEGQGVMGKDLFFAFFGTLTPVQKNETSGSVDLKVEPMNMASSCDCSKTSDFCPVRGGAHGWEPRCKDQTPACASSTKGCGFLWDYSCDGYCVLTRVNEPPLP